MLTSPTRTKISCQFIHFCSAPTGLCPPTFLNYQVMLMTDENQNTHHSHSVPTNFIQDFHTLHKRSMLHVTRCPKGGRENVRLAAFSNLNIKYGNKGLSNMIWWICEDCMSHPWGNLILGSLHLPRMVSAFELLSPRQDNEFWILSWS